jgi:hypothetical protein
MPDAIQPTTFAIHVGATIFFVLANGFFVAAEFALAKVRLNEFDALADAGDSRAKLGATSSRGSAACHGAATWWRSARIRCR